MNTFPFIGIIIRIYAKDLRLSAPKVLLMFFGSESSADEFTILPSVFTLLTLVLTIFNKSTFTIVIITAEMFIVSIPVITITFDRHILEINP